MEGSGRSARRRSWYGAKRHVKRLLALRLPHALIRILVRLRPELRRQGRLPAPAGLAEVEGEVQGVRFVMTRPDRCIVAKELYWGRGRRPRREDQLALEVFGAAARDAEVALDVGAYTGLFTLVAARANPRLEAHAFELVPANFHALFENCVRNDVLDRVTLHHVGVGEPGRTVRVPRGDTGSALPDFLSSSESADAGVAVRLVALDSILDRVAPGARTILKVDVEGAEAAVFRYGQRLLAERRPLILCEVLPGADGAALAAALEPYGYSFHLVREGDLAVSDGIEPDWRFRDWLFLPRAWRDVEALGVPTAPSAGLVAARGPA